MYSASSGVKLLPLRPRKGRRETEFSAPVARNRDGSYTAGPGPPAKHLTETVPGRVLRIDLPGRVTNVTPRLQARAPTPASGCHCHSA